jgi:molecular chaperone GrpE
MSDSFFDGPVTNEGAEEVQRLREALEAKTREVEAQQDRYLRTVAEFDNVRKRSAREREEYTRYANESLLRDILPEPATSLTTGVELIQRELLRVLEKFGVAPFNSVGQPFDPERHEAIARVPSTDLPDMTVAAETARGYLLHGRVLRPAMVTVAVAPDDSGSAVDA